MLVNRDTEVVQEEKSGRCNLFGIRKGSNLLDAHDMRRNTIITGLPAKRGKKGKAGLRKSVFRLF
jgi:hypothetical protein